MKTWAVLCLAVLIGLPLAAPAQTTHTLPLVRPADFAGQESLVRIVNRSSTSGTVRITAIDDTGRRFGPVTLTLGTRQRLNITSGDLERGNAAKGLPVGVGNGRGSWRLELATALTIEPLAYIRTPDGFLTSMHDEAPVSEEGDHWVPFFNPGSNTSKVSHLRIINPGATAAEVTVTGRDAAGDAGSGTVRLTLAAGAARTLSAQDLERGGAGFSGRLGDGAGKWRLNVRSSGSIQVMSLLSTRTGHLANLSTAPSYAGGVAPPPPPSGDDHGDTRATATVVGANSTTAGRLEARGDKDYFRFELPQPGGLTVQTTGGTDTYGRLYLEGVPDPIPHDDISPANRNFRLFLSRARAGTWYIEVSGGDGIATGDYSLQVEYSRVTTPPPPPTTRWGAYAGGVNPNSCAWSISVAYNYATRESAIAAAQSLCSSTSLDISRCAWLGSFTRCGAVAYGERRVSGRKYCKLRAYFGGSSGEAEQQALSRCREGSFTCSIAVADNGLRMSHCNTGYAAANQDVSVEAGEVSSIKSSTRDSQSRKAPRSPR